MRKSRWERPAGLKQAQCGDRLECWPVARIEAVLRIRRSRPLTDHERIGAFGTALAFAVEYAYKPTGQVDSITNLLTTVTSQYAYTDTSSPNAVTSVTDGTATDSFTYDDAGRMLTRTVDSTLTELTWDVSSNLVATSSPTQDVVYLYDTGGQRIAQISVGDLGTPVPVEATVYFGATQITDPDTATTGDVDATRYFTFGGSTVATATSTAGAAPVWALLFGDIQGSAQVMMELVVDTGETTGFETASSSHTITRDAYMPYGAERGGSDLEIDRGWLGQIEDQDTGLTYLNARYYDPAIGRFLSPDPLMDPGDPRTLDPYRYADNNPIVYTDASGLAPSCSGLTGTAYTMCNNYSKDTHNYITGKTVVENNIDKAKGGSSGGGKNSGGSGVVSEPVVVGWTDKQAGTVRGGIGTANSGTQGGPSAPSSPWRTDLPPGFDHKVHVGVPTSIADVIYQSTTDWDSDAMRDYINELNAHYLIVEDLVGNSARAVKDEEFHVAMNERVLTRYDDLYYSIDLSTMHYAAWRDIKVARARNDFQLLCTAMVLYGCSSYTPIE